MGATARMSVQIDGTVDGLNKAMEQATTTVRRASASMQEQTSGMAQAFEGAQRRFEHSGVMIAFAVSNMADGSQKGVDRALHSIALLGFAFGPVVGAVTTAVALILEQIKSMVQESEKQVKEFQKSLAEIANSGDMIKMQKTLQDLLIGTPLDPKTGEVREKSELVPGAWKGSLEDLRAQVAKITSESKGFTIISRSLTNELATQEAEYRKLTEAMEATATQQSHLAKQGELPKMTISVKSDKRIAEDAKKAAAEKLRLELDFEQMAMESEEEFYKETAKLLHVTLTKSLDDTKANLKEMERAREQSAEIANGQKKLAYEYQATLDKDMEKRELETLKAMEEGYQRSFDRIQGAVETAFDQMKHSGGSFGKFMQDIARQMLFDFLRAEVKMTEARMAEALARRGITLSAAAMEKATAAASAMDAITRSAARAAAAVYSGTVEFLAPVMGPVAMIPAGVAAGAAFAAVEAFGALASAAGGFDVPSGMNPLTQLHSEEMVLPASLANAVRGMAAGGATGGGDVHLHIHAIDSVDTARWARQNTHTLGAAALAHIGRGGGHVATAAGRR